MFKQVIELKYFGRAISNEKVEKEAVQLTDWAGQKFEGNPNSNFCGRIHESKIKSFRKVASIIAQQMKFPTTLPLNSAVMSLYSHSAMGTLF